MVCNCGPLVWRIIQAIASYTIDRQSRLCVGLGLVLILWPDLCPPLCLMSFHTCSTQGHPNGAYLGCSVYLHCTLRQQSGLRGWVLMVLVGRGVAESINDNPVSVFWSVCS